MTHSLRGSVHFLVSRLGCIRFFLVYQYTTHVRVLVPIIAAYHNIPGPIMRPVYVCSIQHRREYMEDRYSIHLNSIIRGIRTDFLGVYDGHSGEGVAEYCSLALPQLLRTTMWDCPLDTPSALRRSISVVDDETPRDRSGSTLCMVVVDAYCIISANVGDSKAVLRTREHIITLTRDHRPSDPEERRRIESLGGRVVNVLGVPRVNGNLNLSRAIGDWSEKPYISSDPHISTYKREDPSNDLYIIVASDGVWDFMTPVDVCRVIDAELARGGGGSDPAKRVVEAAVESGSGDNITAVVYMCH